MISQTLRKLRENSGLTQQQVADAINVERSTYAYYETGKTTPDIDTIITLSKIFNVSYIDIFESEERAKVGSFYDVSGEEYLSAKKQESIYDLNKHEKTLLCYFRALSEEEQEEFLTDISERFNKSNVK